MTRDRADDSGARTTYQCPKCELEAPNLRTIHTHWMRVHAEEHGHFADIDVADIEVSEE